jgi:hypothetical protein
MFMRGTTSSGVGDAQHGFCQHVDQPDHAASSFGHSSGCEKKLDIPCLGPMSGCGRSAVAGRVFTKLEMRGWPYIAWLSCRLKFEK